MALSEKSRQRKNERSKERYYENRERESARKKQDRIDNPDKYKERSSKYYSSNRDKVIEYRNSRKDESSLQRKEYRQRNLEEIREKDRSRYEANKEEVRKRRNKFREDNKDRINKTRREFGKVKSRACSAKRNALKAQATPPWLTDEHLKQIEQIYILAKELEERDGIKYHVDHIIPLRGKIVTGLHVPWNLRVIPASENMKKGNKLVI